MLAGLKDGDALLDVEPRGRADVHDPDVVARQQLVEGGDIALDPLGDLDRIISIYESPNEASGAVMQRIGMTFWRDFPDPVDGRPLHVYEKRRDG